MALTRQPAELYTIHIALLQVPNIHYIAHVVYITRVSIPYSTYRTYSKEPGECGGSAVTWGSELACKSHIAHMDIPQTDSIAPGRVLTLVRPGNISRGRFVAATRLHAAFSKERGRLVTLRPDRESCLDPPKPSSISLITHNLVIFLVGPQKSALLSLAAGMVHGMWSDECL